MKLFLHLFALAFIATQGNLAYAAKEPIPQKESPTVEKSNDTDLTSKVNEHPFEKISLTAYRNGYALAFKKLKLDLKSGRQTITYEGAPKTVNAPSLMPTFDAPPGNVDILSQNISEAGDIIRFDVISASDQTKTLSLRYMFSALNWDISYVGSISPDHKTLDLVGYIDVENNCGVSLSQVQMLFQGSYAKMNGVTTQDAHEDSEFFYAMPRLVDLPHGKKVYFNFLNKKSIPLKQDNIVYVGGEYLYDLKGEVKQPDVQHVAEFKNDEGSGFNFTLPQGDITLYQASESGTNELISTSVLQEKALGQPVPLKISTHTGPSPIICELEQTDYKKISSNSGEAGYKFTITNNNQSQSSARIIVNLPECDWTVVRASMPYDTNSKRQFSWIVTLPSNQSVEIKYRLKLENIR